MRPQPPVSTLTYTLFPYTTLFRSRRELPQPFDPVVARLRNPARRPAATMGFAWRCVGQGRHPGAVGQGIGAARDRAARRPSAVAGDFDRPVRSEEHTSELQSLMRISYAVFCLKKKKKKTHLR